MASPAAQPVRIRYIESLLTNTISQLFGVLPTEWQGQGDMSAQQEIFRAIRETINTFLPYVFFLDFSQKNTNLGLYMDLAVTLVKKTLHVGATSAQTIAPTLAGIIPFPGAGAAGAIVGWLFSLFFLALAAGVGVVSRDFGYTAESLAGMIPVIGSTAMRIIHSGDETATRFTNKMYRIAGITEPSPGKPASIMDAWNGTKEGLWTEAEQEVVEP